MPIVNNNKDKRSSVPYQDAREESEGNKENVPPSSSKLHEQLSTVVDIREHDVPYHMRYCIDNDIRCGKWYNVMYAVSWKNFCYSSGLLVKLSMRFNSI